MGDAQEPVTDLAKPTVEVHKLWVDEQIAEKKYQLARLKADYDKYVQGTMKKMEADRIMLERDIAALIIKKDRLDKFGSQEVIDIKTINAKMIEQQ